MRDVNGKRINEGLKLVCENNQDVRPGFSYTWVRPRIPDSAEKVLEYEVGGSYVRLHSVPQDTEDLYHLLPPEYKMEPEEAMLISKVKETLTEEYPRDTDLSESEQVRDYIENRGEDLIQRTAKTLELDLGDDRSEELKRVKELSELLTKYTAGYGILEVLLRDEMVEDIYVDAPSERNNVYVEIKKVKGMREKCRTNIFLSPVDMKGVISRFRFESGKAFSEAFPVLETNLSEYESRVTAIGSPLSPDGRAFALRRREKEPWTLPKLISVGSLDPLAAGLLSFLIDGRSTLLVAGSRGAGKTTLLGALMLEFPKSQRILTIEDTRELPVERMQEMNYNIQSMQVGSTLEEGGMHAEEALRVSLRLGESAIVLGEVRGEETKTLYEAMRAGTAGSAVLGTIHGNTPFSVYERVVHDMGISKESFGATDIVVIAGIVRPGGRQEKERMVTHISEYGDEDFQDMMELSSENGSTELKLKPTDFFKRNSEKIGEIARSWGMTYNQAIKNIKIRARIREEMVKTASEKSAPSLLSTEWVARSNDKFWNIISERPLDEDFSSIWNEWNRWFQKRVRYV